MRQQLCQNGLSTDSFADNSFNNFSLLFFPAFFFKALATTYKKNIVYFYEATLALETPEYEFMCKDRHVTQLSKTIALAWSRLLQTGCS